MAVSQSATVVVTTRTYTGMDIGEQPYRPLAEIHSAHVRKDDSATSLAASCCLAVTPTGFTLMPQTVSSAVAMERDLGHARVATRQS